MTKKRWLAVVAGVCAGCVWTRPAQATNREQGTQACEPRADGLRCSQADCGDTKSKCRPEVVSCNADGKCRIVKCDCQNNTGCYVRLDDNGRPRCGGKCEEGQDCQERRETLDNGDTLFSCGCVTRECEPRPDGRQCRRAHCASDDDKCRPTAVECDAKGVCIVSECSCQSKEACHVRLDGSGQPRCHGPCEEGNDCKEQREELDNGRVRVTCGCSPRVCEPRADGSRCRKAPCASDSDRCQPTQVSCDAEGNCKVLECDCQDRKACRIRLPKQGTDEEPSCVGGCADGAPCATIREEQAGGGVVYACKCDEQAKECQPKDDGRACNGAQCANNAEKCRPTAVVCDAAGKCRVETCDCANAGQCGVELGDNGQATCRGSCAIGGGCEPRRTPLDDGGVLIECGCQFANCAQPDSSGLRCSNLLCSDDGHRCTPTMARCDANGCRVLECDCRDTSECHVQIDKATRQASCTGGCPDELMCVESRTTDPSGGEVVTCDCVEP